METITSNPTKQQYKALRQAYDYFNDILFYNKLPTCLLTITNTSSNNLKQGFAIRDKWTKETDGKTIHQIALTTESFKGTAKKIYSTLVHEMVHLWQFEFGTPGKRKYHNKEWAFKMVEIGLVPISANGKGTGERVSHHVEAGGRFEQAFEKMPKAYLLPFTSYIGEKEEAGRVTTPINKHKDKYNPTKRNRNKGTYLCNGCNTKIWAKPGLTSIRCDPCDQLFEQLPPKEKN